MKRIVATLTIALVAALLLASCSMGEPGAAGSAPGWGNGSSLEDKAMAPEYPSAGE